MKFILSYILRIKMRYYLSAVVILLALSATPRAIAAAYAARGYKAFGGEYLIIPLGLIVAHIICQTMHDYDLSQERKKLHESIIHKHHS